MVSENSNDRALNLCSENRFNTTSSLSDTINSALDKHWHWVDPYLQEQNAKQQELFAKQLVSSPQKNNAIQLAEIAYMHAAEGMMVMDESGCILSINNSFSSITGFSKLEVLGLIPKMMRDKDLDILRNLQINEKWSGEVLNYRKNGEAYQERVNISIVRDQQQKVSHYVSIFSDITEAKLSQNKLQELVNRDPLTGLPNRRLFTELLEHAIKRADREQHQIALLFVDLDRFKNINDSLGHDVGDKLLYEASKRIHQTLRDCDVVSRIGGDEFLVMLDKVNDEDAITVAQKIIYALQIEFQIDDKEIFISASVGISIFSRDGNDVESLIKAADIAMYQVKNRGKNNFCFYSEEHSKNALERFTLESELRHALARKQFEINYQPQISLLTGEIIGAEALIRWRHPKLGLVSPARFIPIAEETGLIVQIGEWVLRQAAKQAMLWIKDGYTMQWISVNVSGVQIMRSNFYDTVYGILVETDCDPNILELEITESTVMQNTEFVIDTFNSIKQLGVRVAIDDFGTGYSSLSNLKRLPLSKIKIDQSFVRGLPDDLNDAAITNTINAMARHLGFSVIAEGVETIEQADFLKEMGCEEAQGYLYGKPISTAEFTEILASKTKIYQALGNKNAR